MMVRSTCLLGVLILLGGGCVLAPIDPIDELAPSAEIETVNDVDVGTDRDLSAPANEPIDQPKANEPVVEVPVKEPMVEEAAPAQVVKSFSVTARQWSFTPSAITVQKGDIVQLSIMSVDVRHGFKIPAFGVDEALEPNKTTVMEFTADQVGTFPFFCNIFCGDGHGAMNGTLTVTE